MRAAASSRPFPVEPITVAARTAPVSERSTRIFASVPAPWASSSLGASGSTTLVARASTFGAEHAAAGGAGRGSAVWAGSAGARSAPGPFGEPKPVRLPLPSPLTSIGAPLATAIVRGARTRFGRADRAGGGAAGNGGTTSAGVAYTLGYADGRRAPACAAGTRVRGSSRITNGVSRGFASLGRAKCGKNASAT